MSRVPARNRGVRAWLDVSRRVGSQGAWAGRRRVHGDAEESECRILDTAMFVESYDCPGVQVTDLATFLLERRAGGRERGPCWRV